MPAFHILFDRAEASALDHPAYRPYGNLGFPPPPKERPWIFTNFVQTLDGVASLKGRHSSGFDISRSSEDRWLMDLLRAHAGGILYGVGTLVEEAAANRSERGPVFDMRFEECIALRRALGLGREKNIFVTASGALDLQGYRVFDGDLVDAAVITTAEGARRIQGREKRPHVRVIEAGSSPMADLPAAMRALRAEWGITHLLCEGGPTLNGHMTRAGLVDERFLTISPVEAGLEIPPGQEPTALDVKAGVTRRPSTLEGPGFVREEMVWWEWLSCRRAGSHQFNRYRRAAQP